jgi:NIPSNAP protein
MIHELRRYQVKPGKLSDYVEKSGSIGRPIRGDRYGKLLCYWSTELGPLNQVVHLWEFTDLAARTVARAGLAKDDRWVKEYLPASGPLLEAQENMILTPFDWAPFRPTTGMGLHELRVYRLYPGKVAAYSEAMREALPIREKHSTPVGYWLVEIGPLNTVVHLWGYRDLAHRSEVRRALAADTTWQTAAGRLMPLLQSQEATILVPTSYSPCR